MLLVLGVGAAHGTSVFDYRALPNNRHGERAIVGAQSVLCLMAIVNIADVWQGIM